MNWEMVVSYVQGCTWAMLGADFAKPAQPAKNRSATKTLRITESSAFLTQVQHSHYIYCKCCCSDICHDVSVNRSCSYVCMCCQMDGVCVSAL